ncbi:MAG TPA: tetratricopeptide repeat protein, partial [Gemmatimonadaceae bacterium]|nr:tetratricopeptide repeat protein [Gemmatimonadaceae bacterium]
QKGRRASEGQRWDVMAATFRTYVERFPNDAYTPTAQKLIGDALYRSGQYAEAEVQWQRALEVARTGGRRALADSITRTRSAAAATFADTLIRRGEYARAAEEVYLPIADRSPEGERAPEALRDAIETYLVAADSAKSEEDRRRARERAVELSNRLVTQFPNYRYRLQYQARAATLLADLGRNEEAVQALQRLVDENPRWEGRADAMVRLASTLDTLGRKPEAAAAYARFAEAFPRDRRAADALYNAAATYEQAGDYINAGRIYARFAERFPRDERAARARQLQVAALQQSGDTAAASSEIARLCASGGGGEALRGVCAERTARRAFDQGLASYQTYRGETLRIPTVGQLNQAGVRRASQRKQQLLRQLTQQLTRAIETGNPRYLAASTYYIGLAQWEYGRFLENVELPAGLTDEQREAALAGARTQAQEFYTQARATWQALLDKAAAEQELGSDAGAREWLDRARQAVEGNVPAETGASASVGAAQGRVG